MSVPPPNYTQVPNVLLDAIGDLTDAELRVAMAICRQTFGWHKVRDALSLSQLERLTGRGRPAVSAGLKGLMARGWIERTPVASRGGQSFAYRLVVEHIAPAEEPDELAPPVAVGGTAAYQYSSVPVQQRTANGAGNSASESGFPEAVRQRTSTLGGTLAYPQKKEKENKNPPPPPTPLPPQAGPASPGGGGGDREQAETGTASLLRELKIGPKVCRELAAVPVEVARRTLSALERDKGLKSLGGALVYHLRAYLETGEEFAPASPAAPRAAPTPPPLPEAPPIDPERRAAIVAAQLASRRQELRP